MKFSAWLENRTNAPLKNKGSDPRLTRQTTRAEDHSTRDQLLAELRLKFPGEFIKTSEEFSPNKTDAIWITGKKMADYYGKDNTGFDYWVNPKLQRTLKKYGFYLQPYDPETWFAYQI